MNARISRKETYTVRVPEPAETETAVLEAAAEDAVELAVPRHEVSLPALTVIYIYADA